MKLVFGTAFLFLVAMGPSLTASGAASKGKLQFADAAADACLRSCATENESCKRVCPTTFSTPCLNSCDSRMQTCREGCQRR